MCLCVYIRPPNSESPNVFEKHHLSTRKANEITLHRNYERDEREKPRTLNNIYGAGRGRHEGRRDHDSKLAKPSLLAGSKAEITWKTRRECNSPTSGEA